MGWKLFFSPTSFSSLDGQATPPLMQLSLPATTKAHAVCLFVCVCVCVCAHLLQIMQRKKPFTSLKVRRIYALGCVAVGSHRLCVCVRVELEDAPVFWSETVPV
ncbi:hypothetical protein ILYODFUR_026264 [Ilyodon furcidens]|uniref:Uncharacterized protein n=1 Tax=Ilyodon furcidens TaxID=33524 RepID=A0ABV0T0B9_9TELE